jgi:hypothetical protein
MGEADLARPGAAAILQKPWPRGALGHRPGD